MEIEFSESIFVDLAKMLSGNSFSLVSIDRNAEEFRTEPERHIGAFKEGSLIRGSFFRDYLNSELQKLVFPRIPILLQRQAFPRSESPWIFCFSSETISILKNMLECGGRQNLVSLGKT